MFSDKDNVYFRYIFDPSSRLRYSGDPYVSTGMLLRNHFAQMARRMSFPSAVNEFRVAFNRPTGELNMVP